MDGSIATVNSDGLVSLPKSLTSKGSVINYTAYLNGAWSGVDAAPLKHAMSIVPVSANDIIGVVIKKGGVAIAQDVLPDDVLDVEVEYDKDNVTELDFTLTDDSPLLSVSNSTITIANISLMTDDHPHVSLALRYNGEKAEVLKPLDIYIYVPAKTASIKQVPLERDVPLDLRGLVTINGHGHASDKTIIWGDVKIGNKIADGANCANGILTIDSKTIAGTKVTVLYHTKDNANWEQQVFTVAPLSNYFTLTYSKDRDYEINTDNPQLEEGQSVGLLLAYKDFNARKYGLTYSVHSSNNATLALNTDEQNGAYDVFILSAKSGQSGKNNFIEYLIEIQDGNMTYYLGTQNYGKLSPSGAYMNRIAIFNRISGNISVSDNSIEEGAVFSLSGWDALATFNEIDLIWTVNGSALSAKTLASAPNSGFILKISAEQPYNNTTIPFSAEIAFCSIIYKNDLDEILKKTYKKEYESIVIENNLGEEKENCVQTGWSTNINGAKDYKFGSEYGESKDLVLYAYWNLTTVTATIGSSYVSADPMSTSFCDWIKIDDISVCFTGHTSVDALKEMGYTGATVSLDLHINVYGDIEMYLQIYDFTSKKELSVSGLYHSPNGDSFDTTYTFDFDISELDNTHEIQLRFKGRRYVAIWGGRVTLCGDRKYIVKFE